jgi:hypothetical protein
MSGIGDRSWTERPCKERLSVAWLHPEACDWCSRSRFPGSRIVLGWTFPHMSRMLSGESPGFDAVDLPPSSPVTVAGAAPVFHRLPCCLVQTTKLLVIARTHCSS